MATKTLFSTRLEKEFELEVCEPIEGQIVGDSSDITILRASALEKLLFGELANVVSWDWKETAKGAIIVDIKDDTGVHVAGVGDIEYKSLKNRVAQEFPVATAWSRAISAAVVKYLGFEGRVYSDASFEVEDIAADDVEKSSNPLKAAITSIDEHDEVIEDESEEVIDSYPDNVIFDRGVGRGMKLVDIINSDDAKFSRSKKDPDVPAGRQYLKYMSGLLKGDLKTALDALFEKYPD